MSITFVYRDENNKVQVKKIEYEEVKKEIYGKYPKHSVYRSGLLVQEYKNGVELIVEISQRGLWADGSKKIGKISVGKQAIKRRVMCIGQPNV